VIDAIDAFAGTVLIVAPHMDDEVLACGGLIARLPDKQRIHILYATDGAKSPAPLLPWVDKASDDLRAVRKRESIAAVGLLGVPSDNLRFLDLPESQLSRRGSEFERQVLEHLAQLRPDHVLVPFRYDRHPDHLAVNRAVTAAYLAGAYDGSLTEYFVYYRWRLLPGGDLRRYVRPDELVSVDIRSVAGRKREALACFASQTTRYYAWQTRPILTSGLLDEECRGPEVYLRFDASRAGAAVFTRAAPWIRIAHRLEPKLQKCKYYAKATVTRLAGGRA
jgi:LmbE family N-acetylglucosaminyl deacetylase